MIAAFCPRHDVLGLPPARLAILPCVCGQPVTVIECPTCGSENIERDDPRPGEHTCRDCGEWIEEEVPTG